MHQYIKRIGRISLKVWLYLFLVSSLVCLLALRHNNQHMVKLRDAVYAADKANGDVNKALNDLRHYVYRHMNTNLSSGSNDIKPPIQLKYTYQRLYEARLGEIQASNQQLYAAAQNRCQTLINEARAACAQNYVTTHGLRPLVVNIPAGLYQFDFVSPAWSPDLAGWSLVVSLLLMIALIIKFLSLKFSKQRG